MATTWDLTPGLGKLVSKKSRNGDTLGPVELIVWPKQGNQCDWHEQDDQGEVSSSYLEWVSRQDFKNIAYVGCCRHFICVFVFDVVFVIVFVFVFVSSYDFLISLCMFIGGLWSLWAEKKWRKMDIHARAAVWLVNFKDFFLSSIFVHWYTVRWSLYQGVFNDNLVTHLNIPQRCAAMYLLSTAKLLLHWAISISGWLAGPPPAPSVWKPSSYQSISQWQPLAHFLSCLLFIILSFAFSSQHILIFRSVISSQ